MTDIAIRVDHLSKLYPAVAPRARHLGRAQSRAGDSLRSQRHDTLRDALAAVFSRQPRLATDNSELKTEN
jgi:hypothetical protein